MHTFQTCVFPDWDRMLCANGIYRFAMTYGPFTGIHYMAIWAYMPPKQGIYHQTAFFPTVQTYEQDVIPIIYLFGVMIKYCRKSRRGHIFSNNKLP